MTARRTPADDRDATPIRQLAVHVKVTIARLRRSTREAAPPRELDDHEPQVALALDDLGVSLADLGPLLARELREHGR